MKKSQICQKSVIFAFVNQKAEFFTHVASRALHACLCGVSTHLYIEQRCTNSRGSGLHTRARAHDARERESDSAKVAVAAFLDRLCGSVRYYAVVRIGPATHTMSSSSSVASESSSSTTATAAAARRRIPCDPPGRRAIQRERPSTTTAAAAAAAAAAASSPTVSKSTRALSAVGSGGTASIHSPTAQRRVVVRPTGPTVAADVSVVTPYSAKPAPPPPPPAAAAAAAAAVTAAQVDVGPVDQATATTRQVNATTEPATLSPLHTVSPSSASSSRAHNTSSVAPHPTHEAALPQQQPPPPPVWPPLTTTTAAAIDTTANEDSSATATATRTTPTSAAAVSNDIKSTVSSSRKEEAPLPRHNDNRLATPTTVQSPSLPPPVSPHRHTRVSKRNSLDRATVGLALNHNRSVAVTSANANGSSSAAAAATSTTSTTTTNTNNPYDLPTAPGAYAVTKHRPTGTVTYRVRVPESVAPGQEFEVETHPVVEHTNSTSTATATNPAAVPSSSSSTQRGRIVQVVCPLNAQPNDVLEIAVPHAAQYHHTFLKMAQLTLAPTTRTMLGGEIGQQQLDINHATTTIAHSKMGGAYEMIPDIQQINQQALDLGGTVRTHVIVVPSYAVPGERFATVVYGTRLKVTCPLNCIPGQSRIRIVPPP
jgi:hypothetical protein